MVEGGHSFPVKKGLLFIRGFFVCLFFSGENDEKKKVTVRKSTVRKKCAPCTNLYIYISSPYPVFVFYCCFVLG